jgi:Trm5-related predicted tRNA methylase
LPAESGKTYNVAYLDPDSGEQLDEETISLGKDDIFMIGILSDKNSSLPETSEGTGEKGGKFSPGGK